MRQHNQNRFRILELMVNQSIQKKALADRIDIMAKRLYAFLEGEEQLTDEEYKKLGITIENWNKVKKNKNYLKFYLKKKNISQYKLMKIANLNSTIISNYINGKTRLVSHNLQIIAECLNISLDELAYGPEYIEKRKEKLKLILNEILDEAGKIEADFTSKSQKDAFIEHVIEKYFKKK